MKELNLLFVCLGPNLPSNESAVSETTVPLIFLLASKWRFNSAGVSRTNSGTTSVTLTGVEFTLSPIRPVRREDLRSERLSVMLL